MQLPNWFWPVARGEDETVLVRIGRALHWFFVAIACVFVVLAAVIFGSAAAATAPVFSPRSQVDRMAEIHKLTEEAVIARLKEEKAEREATPKWSELTPVPPPPPPQRNYSDQHDPKPWERNWDRLSPTPPIDHDALRRRNQMEMFAMAAASLAAALVTAIVGRGLRYILAAE